MAKIASGGELEHEERVEELARMSSGENITDASLNHARELLRPSSEG